MHCGMLSSISYYINIPVITYRCMIIHRFVLDIDIWIDNGEYGFGRDECLQSHENTESAPSSQSCVQMGGNEGEQNI